MSNGAQEKSAFITPFGHFCFNVMPFDLKAAPQNFVRLMDTVHVCTEQYADAYFDDVYTYQFLVTPGKNI